MFRIEAGNTGKYCDGMSRRSFVQLGVAGHGLGRPAAVAGRPRKPRRPWATPRKTRPSSCSGSTAGRATWTLYDMKPEAPAEYRGIWKPIRTNVPGFEITELFPRQAKIADKFSIVRSLHHDTGDHFAGGHRMLTARGGASGADTAGKYPSIGAIATKVLGPRRPGMPAYVAVPLCGQHRPAARLLRRQLPGHGPQSVRDRRRSRTARTSRSTTCSWPAR